MKTNNGTNKVHQLRSNFVRMLVQGSHTHALSFTSSDNKIPKKIIQFWDNLDRLPPDVTECIESWKKAEPQGFKRLLFDKETARDFIQRKLGQRYKLAYDKCYHPAMQSDYFRLCYIFVEGGCYIDADDVYNGSYIQNLFNDCRLKIQPLCYDISTNTMVSPSIFTKPGANSNGWIFYFNNNPLIAGSGHPLLERALDNATLSLEKSVTDGLPDIQSTTGPGNLTRSIFDNVVENGNMVNTLLILNDWEEIVKVRWELDYRNDRRNWRLSDRLDYHNDIKNIK